MSGIEKTERNSLEKLGKKIAGSERQAKQLVQRALAILGFKVVHESWGMYIETADGKCDVFFEDMTFEDMTVFSASWNSLLGTLVDSREIRVETKEEWLSDAEEDSGSADSSFKQTSNPLFGCESIAELELKLDLHNLVWQQQEGRKLEE